MENRHELLIVEDDPNLGQILKDFLELKGYGATLEADGEAGLAAWRRGSFDLCILDVMLPKKDGFALARDIRKEDAQVPILFLSAKNLQNDTLEGFRSGADDYVTKPFNMEELLYRLRAILRRSEKSATEAHPKVYRLGTLTFDHPRQELQYSDGQTQSLTGREAELLAMLCRHKNQTLERTEALKAVWKDDSYFNARSMDVYIAKLRKLLKADPDVQIVTVHGQGFRLLAPDN